VFSRWGEGWRLQPQQKLPLPKALSQALGGISCIAEHISTEEAALQTLKR